MGLFSRDPQKKLNKQFSHAVEKHDFALAQALLDQGAQVDHLHTYDRTELMEAVTQNDVDAVRFLLKNKANPNGSASEENYTLLMKAVEISSYEIAQLLIEYGADVNARRKTNSWTPLHMAAHQGKGKIVQLLLEKGADKHAKDDRLYTPADWARTYQPRVADYINNWGRKDEPAPQSQPKAAPIPAQPIVAEDATGWKLSAPDEVTYVSDRPQIGYRLTEIFNFGSGTYTRIAQNVKTGAESQTLRFFDEFTNHEPIEKARTALVKLGGKASDPMSKPALPKQGGAP